MLKPCVSLDIFLPVEAFGLWEPGGSIEETAKGEVSSARPGSRSRAEAWDGSPGNL